MPSDIISNCSELLNYTNLYQSYSTAQQKKLVVLTSPLNIIVRPDPPIPKKDSPYTQRTDTPPTYQLSPFPISANFIALYIVLFNDLPDPSETPSLLRPCGVGVRREVVDDLPKKFRKRVFS